jgi:DNA-3-methyladenine glycosylase II
VDGGLLTKAVSVAGAAAVYRLHGRGVARPGVRYEVLADRDVEAQVREHLRAFLSLDDDLGPFYDAATGDEPFVPIVRRLHGLHHVRLPSPFEAACWVVLAAHAPIPAARAMKRRLVERYGPAREVDGKLHRAFPEQGVLAAAAPAELAGTIGNERRAAFLRSVVETFEDVDLDLLRSGDWDEADAWLRSIKGVGPWGSAFVLLRSMGRMDRMSLDMKPLRQAVEEVYGPGASVERRAERYAPWLGYWALYLRLGVSPRFGRARGRAAG